METQTITEDTLIGDIVENYTEVVETLLNYGVHCVGCHVSPFEPLGDGLRSHGMEEEEVEEAITKLNSILSSRKESGNGSLPSITLSVTDSAAKKIKEFCAQKQKQALRVAVRAGGCSGYSYVFDMADKPRADEIVITEKDVTIYVDRASIEKMNGATIDYYDALQGAGFRIQNPQATSKCGCGTSFGV